MRGLLVAALAAWVAVSLVEPDAEAGGELVLVLHEKNPAQPSSASEVKRLFVGDMTYWPNDVAVHPFVRPADSHAAITFHRAIEVTPSRFKRLWQEKQFSGQGMPPDSIPTASGVIARVSSDVGAVGFAMSDEIPAGASGIRLVVVR